jgi:hypothetical protein
LEIKRQSENEFRTAVVERIRAIAGSRFRENETVRGESGRSYRVPGMVLDVSQSFPVAFVVPLPNRASVPAHFTEFFDIRKAHEQVRRGSVYDESSDIRPEDQRLMMEVSEMIPFLQVRLRVTRPLSAHH